MNPGNGSKLNQLNTVRRKRISETCSSGKAKDPRTSEGWIWSEVRWHLRFVVRKNITCEMCGNGIGVRAVRGVTALST